VREEWRPQARLYLLAPKAERLYLLQSGLSEGESLRRREGAGYGPYGESCVP
jgi:hypothetical protein